MPNRSVEIILLTLFEILLVEKSPSSTVYFPFNQSSHRDTTGIYDLDSYETNEIKSHGRNTSDSMRKSLDLSNMRKTINQIYKLNDRSEK